jgi:hypothetical protein
MTLDGTTARFFLNGAFENVSAGTVNAPGNYGNGGYLFSIPSGSPTPLQNAAVHVLYVWNRIVRDAEMLQL